MTEPRALARLPAGSIGLAALLLCACARPAELEPAPTTTSESAPTPSPELSWQPEPFRFAAGREVRYIDYARGADDNDGESPATAWQHHPWDRAARGRAASANGVDTYIFRRGVTYRGSLSTSESGAPDNPIRLTSDPSWGDGDATLSGSVKIMGTWRRCPLPAPATGTAWCTDLEEPLAPRLLWEIAEDGAITRLPLAREPDWQVVDPDDPRSQWWELGQVVLELELKVESTGGFSVGDRITGSGKWRDLDEARDNPEVSWNRVLEILPGRLRIDSPTWRKGEIRVGAEISNGAATTKITGVTSGHRLMRRLVDPDHLTAPLATYEGAVVWAERESMPKPLPARVSAGNSVERSLRANFAVGPDRGPTRFDRYFLEGLPQFLDEPYEHFYAAKQGRLYLRLAGDRDPNQAHIEAAHEAVILSLTDSHNIEVSGLRFAHSNQLDPASRQARRAPLFASAIQIRGDARNISIRHCRFDHLAAGVVAAPLAKTRADVLDHVAITDNDFYRIDGSAVAIGNGLTDFQLKDSGSRLVHVAVLRNRVRQNGQRTVGHWGLSTQGHAIVVEGGELIEVAGNHVESTWGAGIMVYTGAEYSRGEVERPLLRTLVHHNQVINSLLGLQDYGGISVWHGGPAFVYSNISGNPVGYKHAHHRRLNRRDWYRTSAYGVGIYLDSQYKGYVFNNVVWGKNNDVNARIYNAAAFNEAMGFMNVVFNNTFYNYGVGLHKGMFEHNRCYYLGNLFIDIGHKFIQQEVHDDGIEHATLGFAGNVFAAQPPNFGQLGRGARAVHTTADEWHAALAAKGAIEHSSGRETAASPVRDAAAHDFRPRPGSVAVDAGTRVFVPWGLHGVVGEWHFLRRPREPSRIVDESLNMDAQWIDRGMYRDIPRADLVCEGVGKDAFAAGPLEDWTAGALVLDGTRRCSIEQATLASGYAWRSVRTQKSGTYPGSKRRTLDMDVNNFLIEVVLRADAAGVIVAKRADDAGYLLDVDDDGAPRLTLSSGRRHLIASTDKRVDDGQWHHLLVEVARGTETTVAMYVDGEATTVSSSGGLGRRQSLANNAPFSVGCWRSGQRCLRGSIDFLRVARGTLADAETDIDTLYHWEFAGPHLEDFTGRAATGTRRDAGALELEPE